MKRDGHGTSLSRRSLLLGIAGAAGALALGSGAGIWYVSTRTERPRLLTYKSHHGVPVTAFSWSPDGNYIASGDADGTVLVWDTATGATSLTCREAAAKSVVSVSWSPDGTSILAGYTNMLVIWSAQSGKKTFTTTHLSGPATYSPAKPCILSYPCLIAACQNQQSVFVFPSTSLKAPITSFDPGNISTLAFDTQYNSLDLALITAAPSKQIILYEASIPSVCAQNGPPNPTFSYYMSTEVDISVPSASDVRELSLPWGSGGSYLLGGNPAKKVGITGEWKSYEMDHPAEVVAAALCPTQESLPPGANPDGWYTVIGYIATADAEGTVRVWGNDGKYIALQSHSPVHQIAWSPDGNFLAAAHSDGTVQVWQAPLSDIPAIWRNTSFN